VTERGHQLPGGGLTLTAHQRAHLANRVMLQGPKGLNEREIAAWRRGLEQTFNGIPGDVLFTLDSLRLLADQGNKVAATLFDAESDRLGFTRARHYLPGD
jgi:hypothetical protein